MNDSSDALAQALAGIGMPDSVRTPIGTFEFFDGVPVPETTKRLYDGLDFLRGIEVFLNAVPGASLVAMRRGFRSVGIDGLGTIAYTDPRANSGSYFLTPNTETTYATMFFDLRDGPVVVEPPAESLCVVDDFWFRYVADMGIAGPDRGKGGKYLFLPPGYDGDEPDGYFVYRTPTFTNWAVFRALGGVAAVEQTRVYRLADAADPPATSFVNVADKAFNTVHANDFSFFEEIDELVQEEPAESLDPERAGQLAAVGIRHGKSFAPDERLRGILDAAARTAAGISRALVYFPRDSGSYLHAGSSWKQAFVGGSYEFLHDHARLLDARTLFHYFATVITPAMAHAQVGAGSAYAYTAEDAEGAILDGGKTYRLTLPPNPPAKNFWSVDVYDTQTRSLLQTDNPYPSLMSLSGTVEPEDDGSFVLWFGPTPPTGRESNWIRTVPNKSWFPMLRLYGPLEPWFDGTWLPSELEEADPGRS
ncbi:DUF1254 domain-containing protein [Prescottella equi]|uniref:DUF1254 domain-containing protein n=1 Tax=Rhodococcus hoagii TaxID=43767 RepID=UPI001CF6A629|nr:DUF1254 domain-containing protein [Prescottella equi]MCU7528151.1 DUF1254 domain-containing protein [Prescottella equi]MCU7533503.1 DUF1254 domain-containing protein [Prescottella equi]UPH37886.1 DUF1254 domain-containing protein [Prescottella equi]UPH39651.1 DUF1254 domain-containing protein [Prescottella equi]